MSWRSGSKLFTEKWPRIQANCPDRYARISLTARLIEVFIDEDMDPWDIEDLHPEVRAAIRVAGHELQEPERFTDDPPELAKYGMSE